MTTGTGSAPAAAGKVIVVGLDGLEPTIVEAMLAAGELPHMAVQAARGGARVATTSPAQTPVAWSTFATGVNRGGTESWTSSGATLRHTTRTTA